MTYVDNGHFAQGSLLVRGGAYDMMNRLIESLQKVGRAPHAEFDRQHASSQRTSPEQRLVDFQSGISDVSMHLPTGFATGLNRQFANMFDDDAWEAGDDLPILDALNTFLTMLLHVKTQKRPGIGTNGRGSITAFWKEGDNRLTVECYAEGLTKWVLTRMRENGDPERAAAECKAARLLICLQPYEPEVWFGQ
jgi:hypothetical protein